MIDPRTIELASDDVIQVLANRVGADAPWHSLDQDSTTVIRRDGAPVAVFGCPKLWDGYGQAWGFVDQDVARHHGLWLTKEVRRVMRHAMEKFDYRQVRALCFTEEHMRWSRLIGFELETIWHGAGPTCGDVFVVAYYRRN